MKYFGVRVAFFSILTRLQAEWPGIRIPVGARDFFNFQNVQTGAGAYPAFYSVGTGVLSWV